MDVPWILHVGATSTAFPVVAGAVAWSRLSRARRVVFVWAAVATSATVAQRVIAYAGHSNLWLSYLTVPTSTLLSLWALSLWQTRELPRHALRAAMPVAASAWMLLVLLVEDTRTFSALAAPMLSLLGFGAALLTLVVRAIDETEPLTRQDWFWISGGMALYFGALAALMPMARLLIGPDQELVNRAWMLFGGLVIIANSAIAVGMLCPISARRPSGASSLPSPSASASP